MGVNLDELVDEGGLQQDEWSLSGVTFGAEGQVAVVGWSGRSGRAKYYILKCSKCSQDSDLFGEGLFRSLKGSLVRGGVPCGCTRSPRWTQEQFHILGSRKAKELGYTFLGFEGEWKGYTTKIKMSCEKHGEWSSGIIGGLINGGFGCPGCKADAARDANTKPDDVIIASFFTSGSFHPDTQFWRIERLNSEGRPVFWCMSCPDCGGNGESMSSNLQQGQRPCACSPMRQRECYINWVIDDHNNAVGIKFGIANNSKQRIKSQNRLSAYEVRQHSVYSFPDVASCKAAERACKEQLDCGIVLRRDLPDGYTETTSVLNLGRIKQIYLKHGGVLVVNT